MDAILTLVNHFNLYLKICEEIERRGYADTISAEFYQMVGRFNGKGNMTSKIVLKRKNKDSKDEVLEFFMREKQGTCMQIFMNETINEEICNQRLFNLFHEIIKDKVCSCADMTRYSVEDGNVYHHLRIDVTI